MSLTYSAQRLERELGPWRPAGTSGTAYRALADRIRLLLLDGRLPSGTRLPAERELASTLRVSRTTVTGAYAALRAGGYLSSVRGSGSVLSLQGAAAREPGRTTGTRSAGTPEAFRWDLTQSAPPAYAGLAAAYRQALEVLPGFMPEAGLDLGGLPDLRAAVARHYEARGVPTAPDQVMITLGAQHGLRLVAQHVHLPGGRVLIEQPTYPHAIDTFRSLKARLLAVPVDVDGTDVEAVVGLLRAHRPPLAYLMPDFQNPTGSSLTEEERARIALAARSAGTVVIADETTAMLDLDRGPRTPLAAHGENIVSIGSLSKTAWGGMRVGWIRARRDLLESIRLQRRSIDLGTPILEQLTATVLLRDEATMIDARLTRMRAQRDALLAGLAVRFPTWTLPSAPGGLSLWVGLDELSSSALTLAARSEGIALVPGPRFGLDGAFERFIRVPTVVPEAEIDPVLTALARAVRRVADEAPARRRTPASPTVTVV
ncbi:GntR family transcriptional regulator [Tersicoccus solisilvae]|uniref:GntR family transcriptional regulator n=1 Tax=Tersicoccus solisilvae TaxID=1882339 RepID=A0ABQ1NRD3_9MICC|nr:PLP-dependent aminotransferase family protein [Tersicoccus solisilvae]GGC83565.1 GntR family transcriptional regulator [Tersicoccus solisilvae]